MDLTKMVTSKFLQAIASHIHIYAKARETCEWGEGGKRGERGGEGSGREGVRKGLGRDGRGEVREREEERRGRRRW